METVRKLNFQNHLEIRGIFQSTVENMFLYRANSWTLTKKMRKTDDYTGWKQYKQGAVRKTAIQWTHLEEGRWILVEVETRKNGRPTKTHTDRLRYYALKSEELMEIMGDGGEWKKLINGISRMLMKTEKKKKRKMGKSHRWKFQTVDKNID